MRWHIARGQLLGFILIILLVGGLAVFAFIELNAALTSETLSNRSAQASLTAAVLRERFDRVSDLSTSLSIGVRFREQIEAGHWAEAVLLLSRIPGDFSFIDRIFLTDRDGVLRADVPAAAGVRGMSFAHRDWYRGVTSGTTPYVSNVYQRTAVPWPKVIAVAAPIAQLNNESKISGYVVLQVRLDTLLEWAQEIMYGQDAYAIFVDAQGTLAAHPNYNPQNELVDFSGVSWVQDAAHFDSGIGEYRDPLVAGERLVAYAHVQKYDWTVGISQGVPSAFASRDRLLAGVRWVFSIVVVLIILLCGSIIRGFLRLQNAKSEFVAMASHDLKTPLSGLRWTLESLNIPPSVLTDRQQTYLKNLTHYGERLVQSVDGLLNLSRIDLGSVEVRREDTNIREFFKGIQTDLSGYASSFHRDINLSVAPEVPLQVTLDRQLVYHAIQNLLSNAIEYATPQSPVDLIVTTRPDGLLIAVHNIGEPIPPSVQKELFQKFFRAPQARAVKTNGTGIGLYIAKSFALKWGGTIGLDAKGRDITFWVTVPHATQSKVRAT